MMPEILPPEFIPSRLEDLLIFRDVVVKEMNIWVLTVSCLIGPLLP